MESGVGVREIIYMVWGIYRDYIENLRTVKWGNTVTFYTQIIFFLQKSLR
jgi:hypothetical protein